MPFTLCHELNRSCKKLLNFTEQFQEGVTGFERFMEILEIEPDIQDTKMQLYYNMLKGMLCLIMFHFAIMNKHLMC